MQHQVSYNKSPPYTMHANLHDTKAFKEAIMVIIPKGEIRATTEQSLHMEKNNQ